MKMAPALVGSALLLGLAPPPSPAQVTDPSVLTLERIFEAKEFKPETFGPARWLQEGAAYTTLEPPAGAAPEADRAATDEPGVRELVRYDTASGRREVLASAARLTPPGAKAPLEIDDYAWSDDATKLLLFTDARRVWRRKTRGDYWVLDLGTSALRKVGQEAPPSTLMFAKFSPDGRRVGYVRQNDIYVEDLADGRVVRITLGGSRTLVNGTFDWVYEEELGLRDGWRFSPDGRRIAFWQVDASGVKEFTLINNTAALYPTLTTLPYPKAGETNSAVRVGVVSAEGGEVRWMDVPGDPRNQYLARMDWAASSTEIVLQRLNRLQNTLDIMIGDAATGRVRTVLTEKDEAWVDVGDDFRWLAGGKRFTWLSERDGWQRAYTFGRSGDGMTPLTPARTDVIQVQEVDEKGGFVYYIASPDDPTQKYLFRARLDGGGRAERLTPTSEPGTHAYQVSPDGRWAIHTWSRFDEPPVTDLVRLPGHERVRTLAANTRLRERFALLRRRPTEFFRVDIGDGVELDGWCIKPPHMEPGKRYPMLVHVYGEPAGQTVLDRWGGNNRLWHQMLAQRGYVVVSVDNRGTPAPRGRAWRKSIYRQVGILASQDQAAAVRKVREWPFIDPERVGSWGWSGGGQMTLNVLFRHPEIYSMGMAVAFVSDQRLYDTIYQERYMARPQDNPEGYRLGSPITFAHQLEGDLLIVHGTGDDNVHYQSTERLIDALVKAKKRFTMMAYPNRSHSISEGENTSLHLYDLMTSYLETHLPPGPR
ncbi:MAG TPA: S9 family peptidase [Vicinamibacteria bacterium]|nr:S9 family peptidase [Vicinamibacteria bacterium]